jgi:demethylmenaquinone methyltransferase/2-methoxy-6-polyprenyl-1,4-benzoquinol methylase
MAQRDDILPPKEEKTEAVRSMFDAIAPRYEMVNRTMTFGLDSRWRRRTVAALGLAPGSHVIDLACGTGDLSRTAAKNGLIPVGLDLSFGMLAASHDTGPLVQGDASQMPIRDASVDGIVCGYALRNFTDLDAAFSEMARVLRPGGRIALLEVGAPKGQLIKRGYAIWFDHIVPAIGGVLSDAKAYRYLPASTVYLPPAAELRESLVERGFSGVNHHLLSGGLSQLFTATRISS